MGVCICMIGNLVWWKLYWLCNCNCHEKTCIQMTNNSYGCHVGYLYDNWQWRLPCGLFLNRKILYYFSLSKVIPQKTKFNIEYLLCWPALKCAAPYCNVLTWTELWHKDRNQVNKIAPTIKTCLTWLISSSEHSIS